MKVPILSGIYGSSTRPDLGVSMPVNMVPVVLPNGVNDGYMRPADGIVELAANNVSGVDRGGINWDGVLYRVIGSQFVSVASSGVVTVIGNVENNEKPCAFAYGYATLSPTDPKDYRAYLAVLSNEKLFYYDKTTLTQVTDPELGKPIDLIWIDGYFMMTDGTFVFVTELNDPFQILPLSYGTTDVDPDPVVALLKLRNEAYVLNRHTIQVLDNIGAAGASFPFQTIDGGQVTKGCIGTNACCIFEEEIVFLGSGRNEAPGIYFGANANTRKISDVEVDRLLASYTEAELSQAILEAQNDNAHKHLYVHLPDRTLLFDATASAAFQRPVWTTLTSAKDAGDYSQYRARSLVWVYDNWYVGDPQSNNQGYLSTETFTHWDGNVWWEISTPIAYNEGAGALFHELELIALTGRNTAGDPSVSTSYSADGINWSASKTIKAGLPGNTTKRLVWLQQGILERMRIQRFQGDSSANLSVIRLEARIEPLAY